jgi:hypothetical protein
MTYATSLHVLLSILRILLLYEAVHWAATHSLRDVRLF